MRRGGGSFWIVFALLPMYHNRHIFYQTLSCPSSSPAYYSDAVHTTYFSYRLSFYSGLHLCKPLPSLMAHLLLLFYLFSFRFFFSLFRFIHSLAPYPPPLSLRIRSIFVIFPLNLNLIQFDVIDSIFIFPSCDNLFIVSIFSWYGIVCWLVLYFVHLFPLALQRACHSILLAILSLSLSFSLSFLPSLPSYVYLCIVVQWWYLFTDKQLAPDETKSDMLMLDFVFLNNHKHIPFRVYIYI